MLQKKSTTSKKIIGISFIIGPWLFSVERVDIQSGTQVEG
jgi:hypothetical protein